MKRLIVIILAIQIVLLTGCTFPFFGKSSGKTPAASNGQKMVKLEEEQKENNKGTGISESPSVNPEKTAEANEQALPSQTDVTGVSVSSSVSSTAVQINPIAADSTGTDNKAQQPRASINVPDTADAFTESRQPVTVYYQDKDGCLVPMTRWILRQQGIARVAVSLCTDSAVTREELAYYGVFPVIPEHTEILGIDIRNGIATIDFSRQLLEYGSEIAERNIVASVIYTLTEFKTVDKVRILINGYTQGALKYGTDISGALGREDININTNTSLMNIGTGKVDVFMLKKANEGFTYLVPVSVPDTEFDGELPEILVKKLLDEEASGGIYSEMPRDVVLLDCSTNYDILTLNFSTSFVNYGGNTREEGVLKQLAYTVRQVEGIKVLRILVDGKKVELPEGTDISSGLKVPSTINDVMDR